MSRSRVGWAWIVAGAVALSGCGTTSDPTSHDPTPGQSAESSSSASPTPTRKPTKAATKKAGPPRVVGVAAQGLEVPWGVDFLPDGTGVVTERDSGRVLLVHDGRTREAGRVAEEGENEGGLLGVAVSPSYDEDHSLYLYATTATDNRVLKVTLRQGRLGEPTPVLTGIPRGDHHDGGQLRFGPDKLLYISTGETGQRDLAQDPTSLGGKILRLDPRTGRHQIWTRGHRNVQGLAFDGRGRLWASEFGDQTWDELNLIERGANYGWPEVEGKGDGDRFHQPAEVWRTDDASPSGLAFADDALWLGALRGERLWRVPVTARGTGKPTPYFIGRYGRMRGVAVAPDGLLWVTTSNRDGRGDPARTDDRILLVRP